MKEGFFNWASLKFLRKVIFKNFGGGGKTEKSLKCLQGDLQIDFLERVLQYKGCIQRIEEHARVPHACESRLHHIYVLTTEQYHRSVDTTKSLHMFIQNGS